MSRVQRFASPAWRCHSEPPGSWPASGTEVRELQGEKKDEEEEEMMYIVLITDLVCVRSDNVC